MASTIGLSLILIILNIESKIAVWTPRWIALLIRNYNPSTTKSQIAQKKHERMTS